jgi:putative oxidoreductase
VILDESYLLAIAIAFVRICLGILFFFQAYDKVYVAGMKEFTRNVTTGTKRSRIPAVFVKISAYLSSYIELVGGVLLILGVFVSWAYLLLAINLVMVVLGFSFLQPLWDMKHVFPRMAMLAFLMVTPLDYDVFRLSALF